RSLHFWVLALLVSMVQGGSQALSRSMYGSMTPPSKSAEFFGFYNVSSKFAGIIGPALFAVVGQSTGSSRLGIISILIFFLFGALVLANIDHRQGIEAAIAAELSIKAERTTSSEALPQTDEWRKIIFHYLRRSDVGFV
ncbi:MAG: MFS transporter, partial [Deltaproteobacteria bacterium]|nr:MFS transporter [Deltaproteobacteria bacterium]